MWREDHRSKLPNASSTRIRLLLRSGSYASWYTWFQYHRPTSWMCFINVTIILIFFVSCLTRISIWWISTFSVADLHGTILIISYRDRRAWTRLWLSLDTCRYCARTWDWIQFCSKTLWAICVKSIDRSNWLATSVWFKFCRCANAADLL